ncbi:MAG: histidine phosphatase family protein [Pseudomonadales bacterium]|nr:histidine phosphatase family protein [Pseudomonadales bacterium]
MKKNIYLVRHAQYDNPLQILVGRLPVRLSQAGENEARKLQNYFLTKDISKIYSSAVRRCKQTSEIISNSKIPIIYDQRLLETHSAFQGYWEMDWSLFFKNIDDLGGESPDDIYKRVVDFLKSLISDHSEDENIVICSHGDPLCLMYVYFSKKKISDNIKIYNIPTAEYQPKASIRKVSIKDSKIMINKIITVDNLK